MQTITLSQIIVLHEYFSKIKKIRKEVMKPELSRILENNGCMFPKPRHLCIIMKEKICFAVPEVTI